LHCTVLGQGQRGAEDSQHESAVAEQSNLTRSFRRTVSKYFHARRLRLPCHNDIIRSLLLWLLWLLGRRTTLFIAGAACAPRTASERRLPNIQLRRHEDIVLELAATEHVISHFQVGQRDALIIFAKGSVLVHGNVLLYTVRTL